MREVITIHVGQTGVNLGNAYYDLLEKETSISNGNSERRSIFVDFESFESPFGTVSMTGKSDASSNYARGFYTLGKTMIVETIEKVQKIAEQCEGLQGFQLFHSLAGGTGSGFGSLLLERMSSEFGKKPKMTFSVFPDGKNSLEPYNAVLGTSMLMEHSDLTTMFCNRPAFALAKNRMAVETPGFENVNHIVAQALSSFTASFRYQGESRDNVNDLLTQLVPYKNLKFLTSSVGPLVPIEDMHFTRFSVEDAAQYANSREFLLAECDRMQGVDLASSIIFRGDVSLTNARTSVRKIGHCYNCRVIRHKNVFFEGTSVVPAQRSACLVSNNTANFKVVEKSIREFDRLYARRAFLHWFLMEGAEDSEISAGREDLHALQQDYLEIH